MRKELQHIVNSNRIYWQKHALQRMMERSIYTSEVKNVLLDGEIIEEYPDDHPLPSFLMLGFGDEEKPLHVVVVLDTQAKWCYIITAYRPDRAHFGNDFKTRIK